MYGEFEEECYANINVPNDYELEKQRNNMSSVAKAVITVACIGLICAIIDFYVDER